MKKFFFLVFFTGVSFGSSNCSCFEGKFVTDVSVSEKSVCANTWYPGDTYQYNDYCIQMSGYYREYKLVGTYNTEPNERPCGNIKVTEYLCGTCSDPKIDPPPSPPIEENWLLVSISRCGKDGSPFTNLDLQDEILTLHAKNGCCTDTYYYRKCGVGQKLDNEGVCMDDPDYCPINPSTGDTAYVINNSYKDYQSCLDNFVANQDTYDSMEFEQLDGKSCCYYSHKKQEVPIDGNNTDGTNNEGGESEDNATSSEDESGTGEDENNENLDTTGGSTDGQGILEENTTITPLDSVSPDENVTGDINLSVVLAGSDKVPAIIKETFDEESKIIKDFGESVLGKYLVAHSYNIPQIVSDECACTLDRSFSFSIMGMTHHMDLSRFELCSKLDKILNSIKYGLILLGLIVLVRNIKDVV